MKLSDRLASIQQRAPSRLTLSHRLELRLRATRDCVQAQNVRKGMRVLFKQTHRRCSDAWGTTDGRRWLDLQGHGCVALHSEQPLIIARPSSGLAYLLDALTPSEYGFYEPGEGV